MENLNLNDDLVQELNASEQDLLMEYQQRALEETNQQRLNIEEGA